MGIRLKSGWIWAIAAAAFVIFMLVLAAIPKPGGGPQAENSAADATTLLAPPPPQEVGRAELQPPIATPPELPENDSAPAVPQPPEVAEPAAQPPDAADETANEAEIVPDISTVAEVPEGQPPIEAPATAPPAVAAPSEASAPPVLEGDPVLTQAQAPEIISPRPTGENAGIALTAEPRVNPVSTPVQSVAIEPSQAPAIAATPEAALEGPEGEPGAGAALTADSLVKPGGLSAGLAAVTPDFVAPATAMPVPLVESPGIERADSGAPVFVEAPQVEGSPPLSLAQILPPGEAPQPGQVAPSFDLVRVAPDGSAVIAGRAAPGANVQLFSGNIPVAEARASARGEFVVFLEAITPSNEDLQAPAQPEGAAHVVSQDDIVILPAAPDAADSQPVVVRRTPDSVQILQPSGPSIPSNVSLDLVSYSETGAVQLAGRGKPAHTARIYANDAPAGEVLISSGGNWELEIADIAAGRYLLRIDELDASGAVVSRVESPFQREFPEAALPGSFTQGAKIIVQPGNTLWLMATEAYGDGDAYTQIYAANNDAIRDPDLIYPGQIFSIPRSEE